METALRVLEAIANLAAIVTALVTASAGAWFLYQRREKRLRLERYLEVETGDNNSLKGLTELCAELGIPESEIIEISFRSRHIKRFSSPDIIGSPARLLLRYSKN